MLIVRAAAAVILILCASALVPATIQGQARAPAVRGGGKPDLMITGFLVVGGGTCEKGKPVLLFRVTVANNGDAPSPDSPSPKISKALVRVVDEQAPAWANGAFLKAIRPKGSQSVDVPLYAPPDPTLLATSKVHPFRATADPFGQVDEAQEGNNASAVMNVELPVCPR